MQLIVVDTDGPAKLRAAAAFCLMLAGDIAVPSLESDYPADPFMRDETGKPVVVPAGTVTREPMLPPMGNVVPFPPAPPVPSIAPTATVPASMSATATAPTIAGVPSGPQPLPATSVPPMPSAPQPPNFSQQPNATTAQAHSSISTSLPASSGPDEFDKSGLPWDGRIHQKGRSKKKDGTWKLQKGLDPVFAQAVVTELAAKRRAVPSTGAAPAAGVPAAPAAVPPAPAAMPPLPPLGIGPLMPDPPPSDSYSEAAARMSLVPPPPNAPQVPLPPNYGPVPVPPQPNAAPASLVPPPPVTAQVPPAPQPGPVGGGSPAVSPIVMKPAAPEVTPYRLLMDKLTAAVGAKQLDPRRIAPVCQKHGAPNFAELGKPEYAHLVPGAERDFDSLIAGLPVEGIA